MRLTHSWAGQGMHTAKSVQFFLQYVEELENMLSSIIDCEKEPFATAYVVKHYLAPRIINRTEIWEYSIRYNPTTSLLSYTGCENKAIV